MPELSLENFLSQLRQFISRHGLLSSGQSVVVGVSGGPDSLCLLDALRRLGYQVHAAHLDHGIRAEAAEDARFVESVCASLGVPLTVEKVSVPDFAGQERLSLEEAARMARYRFLARVAASQHASALAVGHTADDQVETVLMHFLRGAGTAGLRGMRPATPFQELRLDAEAPAGLCIARPLLFASRAQTEAYCRDAGLAPRMDASNLDTTLFRNRLRHELLPYLESFNPRIRAVIARLAEVMAADHEALEASAAEAWRATLRRETAEAVWLDRQTLERLMPGLQRAVMRRAISRLRPGLRDIDFETVERSLNYLRTPPKSGHADLASGLWIEVLPDEVIVRERLARFEFPEYPRVRPGERIVLRVPGEVRLGDSGWHVVSEEFQSARGVLGAARQNDDPWTAWFDLDAIGPEFALRTREPGDRIRPLGMGGHRVRLSDLMINCRILGPAREGWPVLVAGDEVVWVPGARPSELGKVTGQTRRAVRVRIVRPGG